MNAFRKMVEQDHKNIFLNAEELGEIHNLNGTECLASVQSLTDKEKMAQQNIDFDRLGGETVNVFAVFSDVGEEPCRGQLFRLDGKIYYVQEVVNNYDMLKITLGVNKP